MSERVLLEQGTVLEGLAVCGVGLKAERLYPEIIEDLDKIRVRDFSGNVKAFFLFMKGKRISARYKHDW